MTTSSDSSDEEERRRRRRQEQGEEEENDDDTESHQEEDDEDENDGEAAAAARELLQKLPPTPPFNFCKVPVRFAFLFPVLYELGVRIIWPWFDPHCCFSILLLQDYQLRQQGARLLPRFTDRFISSCHAVKRFENTGWGVRGSLHGLPVPLMKGQNAERLNY